MRRTSGRAASAVALVLAGSSFACRPRPEDGITLVRLADRLGPVKIRRVEDETRPAVALYPDEPRYCTVESRPGSVLVFGLLASASEETRLSLHVLADRRPLLVRHFRLRRKPRVFRLRVPLEREGPVELGFQVRLVGAQPPQQRAQVALASPRLYRPGPRGPRRVLVWISQDSLRADHLGAYGYSRPTSPVFDRLAREGVLFERAVATAPWTLPSLASQFTSRLPSDHGLGFLGRMREAAQPTLWSALAAAGFTVLGVTGNRFVSDEFGTAAGFDALWYSGGRADDLNRVALGALDEWPGGDLALFLHYLDPHFPYQPPPAQPRFDPGYRGSVDGEHFEGLRPEQEEDVGHVRALYDAEVAFNDAQIGRLLSSLRERGLLERAVLVYSSDHGEEFLDHGGWKHSRTLYEELIRVPLLLRLPGAPARRVREPVSLVDLAPTLLEALGVGPPPTFQGRSLLPLAGGDRLEERAAVSETLHGVDGRHRVAVQRGSLKAILVMPRAPEPPRVVSEERFDLAADPRERRPLPSSEAYTRLRAEALALIERARAGASGTDPLELSPETLEELRALGYIQ